MPTTTKKKRLQRFVSKPGEMTLKRLTPEELAARANEAEETRLSRLNDLQGLALKKASGS